MHQITRTAQVLKNDSYEPTPFVCLNNGDVYKLFEEDGTQVLNQDGSVLSRCTKRAYVTKGMLWTIGTELI